MNKTFHISLKLGLPFVLLSFLQDALLLYLWSSSQFLPFRHHLLNSGKVLTFTRATNHAPFLKIFLFSLSLVLHSSPDLLSSLEVRINNDRNWMSFRESPCWLNLNFHSISNPTILRQMDFINQTYLWVKVIGFSLISQKSSIFSPIPKKMELILKIFLVWEFFFPLLFFEGVGQDWCRLIFPFWFPKKNNGSHFFCIAKLKFEFGSLSWERLEEEKVLERVRRED